MQYRLYAVPIVCSTDCMQYRLYAAHFYVNPCGPAFRPPGADRVPAALIESGSGADCVPLSSYKQEDVCDNKQN